MNEHSLTYSRTALILASVIALAYGGTITSGLYLDDHSHYQQLRDRDWSFHSAVESSYLPLSGETDLWVQRHDSLRFFRPVAFWCMKAEYTLVRWHPVGMHVFSLLWHWLCCLMLAVLAQQCFGRRRWALLAGILMAIHPAHVITISWIACQTELFTTFLIVTGVLAYGRCRGWAATWISPTSALPSTLNKPKSQAAWAALAILCYGLALGCRENAVLFPVICWMGDRWLGTRPRRWILQPTYLLMAALLGVYLLLRWHALGGFPVPPPPYLVPTADPHFVSYVLNKVVIYTLALAALVPIVPFGSQNYLADHPVVFYGSFAVLVIVVAGIWAAYRFRRSLLWPMAWVMCFTLPVLPVFDSPHHLYLPAVGAMLLLTAGLMALAGVEKTNHPPVPAVRTALAGGIITLQLAGFALMQWSMSFTFLRGMLPERMMVDEVLTRGGPIHEGDHLFFINLPPMNYWATSIIRDRLDLKTLHGHALTCATGLMRQETPSSLEVVDDHTLLVRAPDGDGYLAGTQGKTILAMMGWNQCPTVGQRIEAGPYTVEIVDGDEQGCRALRFTFHQPLNSPEYHFYFGSPWFLAYPLKPVIAPTARTTTLE